MNYSDKPWINHYEEGVKTSIQFEELFLPQMLEGSAQKYPDHIALIFQGYKVSYQELSKMVDCFGACLQDFGIIKGDRVAVLLPNVIHCVVAYYAILKIGAIAVMNNPLYTDRELEHQLNDCGAKVLITLDLLGNRMAALRPLTLIKEIVCASIGDYLPFPKNLLFPLIAKKNNLAAKVNPDKDIYKWKHLLKSQTKKAQQVPLDTDDIAMYQYTGGTTGVSKGAMLTHGNLSKQTQQVVAWFPMFEEGKEIMLGALPFFHVFGLSIAMNFPIFAGWTNILVPRPQAKVLLEAICKYKPTFAPLVPTMYISILQHYRTVKADLSSIKGCFSGSAPLPVEVLKEFERQTGAVIVEGYGLTETSPVTHINPFNGLRKPGSIGIPIPNTDVCIAKLDQVGVDAPIGEPGEILIKGPQVMKGYHNLPQETAKTFTPDGWFKTGDIGRMDSDGYFYIVDRKKDMIITSGYNVYPREIEDVLGEHPKIMEICAVGITHDIRGEVIKIFIVLWPGMTATKDDILDYCKLRLAKYKWPHEIEFRESLPKSNVGKIMRKDLR